MKVLIEFEHVNIRLREVLYNPPVEYSLVSTGRQADNDLQSRFRRHDEVLEHELDGSLIASGTCDPESKMYMLQTLICQNKSAVLSIYNTAYKELWHLRLAHLNTEDMSIVHTFVDDIPKLFTLSHPFGACEMGKAHKLPLPALFSTASAFGEVIHSDIF